jgi:hypothetical protein
MNFVRLGLKPRVYSSFAVLVGIALALACFTIWELLSIETGVQKFSAINDNTTRALEVSNRIEIILRSNLRYAIRADEQSIKDAETAEASAIELLNAAADATLSEERRTIYNGLRSDIVSLRAKRETLVGFVTQMTADRAKLFTGGDELIAAAEELVQQSRAATTDDKLAALVNPIESSMLLVRVANWRFLATRDPKGPATFKTNADDAVAAIAALEKAELPASVRPLIEPVKASLTAYMLHFDSMAANLIKSDDLYWNSMMPQADDMAAKLGRALVSLRQDSDTTKAATFAGLSDAISTHEEVTGLALVLGVLIAWFVSRTIIAQKQADRRIRFMAHHDTLTGLINRARLIEILDNALQISAFGCISSTSTDSRRLMTPSAMTPATSSSNPWPTACAVSPEQTTWWRALVATSSSRCNGMPLIPNRRKRSRSALPPNWRPRYGSRVTTLPSPPVSALPLRPSTEIRRKDC